MRWTDDISLSSLVLSKLCVARFVWATHTYTHTHTHTHTHTLSLNLVHTHTHTHTHTRAALGLDYILYYSAVRPISLIPCTTITIIPFLRTIVFPLGYKV